MSSNPGFAFEPGPFGTRPTHGLPLLTESLCGSGEGTVAARSGAGTAASSWFHLAGVKEGERQWLPGHPNPSPVCLPVTDFLGTVTSRFLTSVCYCSSTPAHSHDSIPFPFEQKAFKKVLTPPMRESNPSVEADAGGWQREPHGAENPTPTGAWHLTRGRCPDDRTGGSIAKGAETKHGPCFQSNG